MLLSLTEDKARLRKALSEKRKSLSENERKEYSKKLCESICSLEEFKEADAVLSFWPLPDETDVRMLNAEALRLGKTLLLPRCVKGTRQMSFYTVRSFDELEKGSFSIFEPKESCPLFVPSEGVKAICIVPGLAYDKRGFRIGYGGGYYDRYLSKYTLFTVGAVYHPFFLADVPCGEFDVKVDAVVTDKEITYITSRGN